MPLQKEIKKNIIKEFKTSTLDTGSEKVQVALLTGRIKMLTEHFKIHKKDNHGQKGLKTLINRRSKLLKYIKSKSIENYTNLIKSLGLRR
ncbi:MAG: 30S ribosomal protein S15 [Bdellovibrionaceae bacterium]|nr:30S ribosomal protein S15 [Pseudobdellovibrionaceae bacterium]